MRPSRANALLIGVLVLLAGGLAVLATLQYRWIDEVSEAEKLRMRASLELAARQFAGDFESEIVEIFGAFAGPDSDDVARSYEEWRRSAAHPKLIEAVYAISPDVEQSLDLNTVTLVDAVLPEGLDRRPTGPPFNVETLTVTVRERRPGRPGGPGPDGRGPEPGGRGDGPEGRRDEPEGRRDGPEGRRDGPEGRRDGPEGPGGLGGPPPFMRALMGMGGPRSMTIVRLDRSELTRSLLPKLVRRHFDSGYAVALVTRDGVLFRSDPAWPDGRNEPDVDVPVPALMPPEGGGPRRFSGPGSDRSPLHLLIRRRDGGVDARVASVRRRNLAVSFGIVMILATTISVLLYLLRRADRLREQQTEFVAAISHELNTPVTALRSAGENLKDGIITDREKLARYGETIVKESARLADMIDQVLEFAGMRGRRTRARNEPVDLGSVIEDAAAQCRLLGDTVRIEISIEPDLPQPSGDPVALTRAVQNLIANAVRHGGSGGWVGVRAARDGASNVTITVEDRGPGIDSRDAAHLFEPFYRGRGTSAVRGAGLGLTIVQQVVSAHGGTIRIDRRRRQGAAFIITLPRGSSSNGERHV
jgi:signal transduction histidine kinase